MLYNVSKLILMSPKQNTRSSTSKTLGCVKIKEINTKLHTDPVTGGLRRQAAKGVEVLGRVSFLTKQLDETGANISTEKASKIAAQELNELWIHGLNIYPMTEVAVAKKFKSQ